MNAISALMQSLGVDRATPVTKAISNILAIVFLQSAVSKSDIAVTNELTRAFLENDDLRAEFVREYRVAMKQGRQYPNDGITVENGLHIALVNTIMNNRELFPQRAFSIKTDLPGVGSIATEIPAAGAMGRVHAGSTAAVDRLATLLGEVQAERQAALSSAEAARAYAAQGG